MRSWCLSVRLSFLISLSGCLSITTVSSVWASEKQQDVDTQHETSSQIPQLSEIELPATSAQLLVQSPTPSNTPVVPGSIVPITGVKANPTDKGVEVIVDTQHETSSQIPQLSEIELPATSAQLLVQTPTPSNPPVVEGSIVTITGVKANPSDKGVEVILETTLGEQLQVTNRSAQNNFIADIPNAQLRLSSGEAFTFRSEKPVEGITEITVTNIDANTVRVTVVGVAALPTVELFNDDAGLVFGVASTATAIQPPEIPPTEEKPASETPAAQQDDEIDIVVTADRDAYRVPNASTATRTDTPLRDIPQSIQVVPRQVLEDRNVRNLAQATETVSGVIQRPSFDGAVVGNRIIRGFSQNSNFRNGFRDITIFGQTPIGTIEQVEVLKGPASVLFGNIEPGGIINVITRQPLSEPYYNLAFEAGSYGFYQPSIDLSGPLTADDTLLYRFIAAYEGAESYQDFVETETITIAPSITLNLGEQTRLNLYYEYVRFFGNPPVSTSVLLSDGSLSPQSFYPRYPDLYSYEVTTHKFGYTLNHEFSDNWQIRNNIAVSLNDANDSGVFFTAIENDRFLTGFEAEDRNYAFDNYFGQIDLLGRFNTGSISHQLLIGFDYDRLSSPYQSFGNTTDIPPLDILDPNYDIPRPEYSLLELSQSQTQSYGVYLQDQIALSDNLKLLIGGRYDWISSEFEIFGDGIDSPYENDNAFSPRIGLVYQPSDTISLYASYSRSFVPTGGRSEEGERFDPSRGTQYEVGVKTDWLDGRLSAALAAYHLTKTNITTTDPDNPLFSVQTGEARSQGIELDVTGEILPGWNVTAAYAYTNAEVTEDNTTPVGNRLSNVPENQASLWTTYTIQTGDLEGLGFGLGLFYVGEREGDLAKSFQLDGYLRTDAAIYYRRGPFRGAVNLRNLFNITYADAAYSTNNVSRGNPFTVVGSVSWEF